MSTVRTNEIINEQVLAELSKKYGDMDDNPRTIKCPFYKRKETLMVSQRGEEGILVAIFEKIGFESRHAVEFGAWDGEHFSNTYFFWKNHGFTRTMMEGNLNYIQQNKTGEKITHCLVNSRNINDLLTKVPEKYDLLCLDIDGDDYWVMKAMTKKPRVIILEYHNGLPNNVPLVCMEGGGDVKSYTGEPFLNGYYGANLLAFYRLLKSKGYSFVTTNADNAYFVIDDEFHKLGINPISEEECIADYFHYGKYWGWTARDKYNKEWLVMTDP